MTVAMTAMAMTAMAMTAMAMTAMDACVDASADTDVDVDVDDERADVGDATMTYASRARTNKEEEVRVLRRRCTDRRREKEKVGSRR